MVLLKIKFDANKVADCVIFSIQFKNGVFLSKKCNYTRKSSLGLDAFLADDLDGEVLISSLVSAMADHAIRSVTKRFFEDVVI